MIWKEWWHEDVSPPRYAQSAHLPAPRV